MAKKNTRREGIDKIIQKKGDMPKGQDAKMCGQEYRKEYKKK